MMWNCGVDQWSRGGEGKAGQGRAGIQVVGQKCGPGQLKRAGQHQTGRNLRTPAANLRTAWHGNWRTFEEGPAGLTPCPFDELLKWRAWRRLWPIKVRPANISSIPPLDGTGTAGGRPQGLPYVEVRKIRQNSDCPLDACLRRHLIHHRQNSEAWPGRRADRPSARRQPARTQAGQ
ncbi:unnamed protein product [Calypogeia fissa]